MLKQRGLKTQVRTLIKERQKGSAYQGHFFPARKINRTSKTLHPIPITQTFHTVLLNLINLQVILTL